MSSSFGGAPALPGAGPAGPAGPAGATPAPAGKAPSAIGYWVAGVIIVVGAVAALIWFVSGVSNLFSEVDTYPRFAVPGRVTAPLEADRYKVFAEYPGASGDVNGVFRVGDVTVADSSGRSIPVRSSFTEETYNWNGHEGRAIAEFTAPTTGSYTIEATGPRTPSSTSVRVAVGRGLQPSAIFPLFAAAGLGGLALLAGIVLIVVTAVRRGRAKRRANPIPAFAGGYPPGYPGGQLPGYPGPPGAYGQWGAPPGPGQAPGGPPAWGAPPQGPLQGWGAPVPPPSGVPYPPYPTSPSYPSYPPPGAPAGPDAPLTPPAQAPETPPIVPPGWGTAPGQADRPEQADQPAVADPVDGPDPSEGSGAGPAPDADGR